MDAAAPRPHAIVSAILVAWISPDADGYFRVIHGALRHWHIRDGGNKKTAGSNQEPAVKARRDFCSTDFSPLHIEGHSPFSHRGISLSPVGSTGFPMRS